MNTVRRCFSASCLAAVLAASLVGACPADAEYPWALDVKGVISKETKKPPRAYLWLPPLAKKIEAVILGMHNMLEEPIFAHPAFRSEMEKARIGICWVTPMIPQKWDELPESEIAAIESLMRDFAALTGHAELSSAPLVPFGHSAMATYPYLFAAARPGRTRLAVSIKGDWPCAGRPCWAAAQSAGRLGVPMLLVTGEYEDGYNRRNLSMALKAAVPEAKFDCWIDVGGGHFDWSDELCRDLGRYIACPDRKIIDAYEALPRGKGKVTALGIRTKDGVVKQNPKAHMQIIFETKEMEFEMEPVFEETVPPGRPETWTGLKAGSPNLKPSNHQAILTIQKIQGPIEHVGGNKWRVKYGRYDPAGYRAREATFQIVYPGDGEFKRCVQQGLVRVPPPRCAAARTFVHPGIDCSRADIERARAMVAGGREPWASAFAALRDCGYSDPDQDVPTHGTSLKTQDCNYTIGLSGRRAHDLALLWRLTDDERYAKKAVEFINANSHYDDLDLSGTAPLDYGKVFLLVEAAELMRDWAGWAASDRLRFMRMLREKFYPILKDGDPARFGNQGLFALRSVLAMSIFLEDEKMYDRVWRYLNGLPHRADDEPYVSGPPNCEHDPVEVTDQMETFKLRGRDDSVADYGYDEQLRHYIYANGQCQESSRDQAHVMAGLFMYVAIAEAFWIQGDDLYGALDNRILTGLEWSFRYNLSDWAPTGFTDEEKAATFENGLFYRARHRSGRWRSLSPSAHLRGALGTEGAPRECAYAHYRVRMGMGEEAVSWLKTGLDEMNGRHGGFETWGMPPNWFYEWSGWGTLMKRRTPWMSGDPVNGIHRVPCRIDARDCDGNRFRQIKPSYTLAADKAGEYELVVAYRSSKSAQLAFSCDKSKPLVVTLPPRPFGGTFKCGDLPVPVGASVMRYVVVAGANDIRVLGFQLDTARTRPSHRL